MKLLLIPLLAALLPFTTPTAEAETLRRSYRKPAPETFALRKDFYKIVNKRSTCYKEQCGYEDRSGWERVCEDKWGWKDVCNNEYVCDPSNNCEWKETCRNEYVRETVCEDKYVPRNEYVCHSVPYACTKKVKVRDRKWEVTLKPVFDSRAVLEKPKDEKIDVKLEGDEKEPKLAVKVLRSPFKYTVDCRFDATSKEVSVEFRLDETGTSPPAPPSEPVPPSQPETPAQPAQ